MRYRNYNQNKELHYLLGKLNIDKELKEDMVMRCTSNRTNSSSKMSVTECQALINELRHAAKQTPEYVKSDLMRKKIISSFKKVGYTAKDGTADMLAINNFCVKRGYLHKELNKYTYKELPKLVYQVDQVYKSFTKSVKNG